LFIGRRPWASRGESVVVIVEMEADEMLCVWGEIGGVQVPEHWMLGNTK